MADTLVSVSVYTIVMGFWTCLGVTLWLSLISPREPDAFIRRGQLPESAWPDAKSFFPWRLWW